MNDKINELIEQATIREESYPAGCNGHPEVSYYFDKRKYAELIIKECIDLMKEKQAYYENPGLYESDSYYERMDAKADAFSDAANEIKYYFSV